MAYEISHFSCCRSPLPDLSGFSVLFLRVFVRQSVQSVMGKDKQRQSRALRCLEPYNNSPHGRPKDRASGSSGVVHTVHGSSVGSSAPRRLHNPQSRLSSCWSSSKRTRQSSNASRTSSQVHLQK